MVENIIKNIDELVFKWLWIINDKQIKVPAPKFIKIETTNYCNGACKYCPHSGLKREKKEMSSSLFERIINDCVKLKVKEIHLTNFGESLLDSQLFKRIEYIKSKSKKINTTFITNGFLLNNENIKKIIESKIDKIKISFDGFSSESYEKYRTSFKFYDIKKKVENLIKNNEKGIKIILNSTYSPSEINRKQIKNFYSEWTKKVDFIDLQKIHNWAKGKDYYKNSPPCLLPSLYATILVNGDVVPCCLDYEGKIKLGNIYKESLGAIWNSKKYEEFRKDAISLKKRNVLCKKCNVPFLHKKTPYFSAIKYKFGELIKN